MEQNAMFSVFSILYDYSVRNQLLDEVAIREIVRIYLIETGLNGLVRDVVFTDLSNNRICGYYNLKTRIIFFDLNFTKKTVYERHYADRFYINCINLINQVLIINVFHEINHALRFSLPHSKFDMIDLISKDIWKLETSEPDLYKRLHNYFPTEKEANVFGYERCVWLFQYLNRYISDSYGLNNLYISFLKTIMDGYDMNSFLSNPLKKVALSSKVGKEELRYGKYLLMEKAIEIKNMTLYDRLTFGFPIKEDEYEFVNGILETVSKYKQDENLDIKGLILSKK